MRLSILHGLAAVGLVSLAAACDDRPNRNINDPATQPVPQQPFNDPQPRAPSDPIANDHNPPQSSTLPDPQPQSSTLPDPKPQEPYDPQKPFYGPGLTPDDRTAAKTEKPLSDMEIVGVAFTANNGEVQMAELAKKKATNTDVKQFAALMYTHHTQGVQKTKNLETKSKLTRAESDLSQKLKSDVASTMTTLRDKEGREFDKAYMDAQVKQHKEVLTAMDDRLIPHAQNTELKTLLGEMRRQVADHLSKAQDIQGKLEKSPAATTTPGTTDKMKGKHDDAHKGMKP